jgi:hypothetical protein
VASQLPLNVFRVRPFELTTTEQIIYTAPQGYTGIILGAQITNLADVPVTVRMVLTKNDIDYIMLKDFEVPVNDAAEGTTGKLVVEEGATLKASAGINGALNIVISLLETTNE